MSTTHTPPAITLSGELLEETRALVGRLLAQCAGEWARCEERTDGGMLATLADVAALGHLAEKVGTLGGDPRQPTLDRGDAAMVLRFAGREMERLRWLADPDAGADEDCADWARDAADRLAALMAGLELAFAAAPEPDVEASLERIAAVMQAEADDLADEYPLIASAPATEAERLRGLTG